MRAPGYKSYKRYRMLALLAAVLVVCGIFWLIQIMQKREGAATDFNTDDTAVLSVYQDGWHCTVEDGRAVQYEDEDFRQYFIDIKNQFYELSQITVSFDQAKETHELLFFDEALSLLNRDEVKSSSVTYTVPDEVAYLCFSCRNGTDEHVKLTGKLSEKGVRERKRETVFLEEFAGKSISVLGDSISAYAGCVPPAYSIQYPAEDVTVRNMWWFRLAKKFGMDICAVNACAGSGVTEYAWASRSIDNLDMETRVNALRTAEKTPDIICVWIGANDVMGGAPRELVYENYQKMIDHIKSTYPAAKIYVCTYYNTSDKELWLNEDIRTIAEKEAVKVIDVADCGITRSNANRYLLSDGIHPNAEGMHLIAAWMGEELR